MRDLVHIITVCCSLLLLGCPAQQDIGGDQSNSRDKPQNNRPSPSSTRSIQNNNVISTGADNQKDDAGRVFIGCWSGSKGGFIDIGDGKIDYVTQGKSKTYHYTLSTEEGDSKLKGYLLNVDATYGDVLGQVVWIRISPNGDLILYSYHSRDDLNENRFIGAGEFVRDKCDQ